MTDTDPTPFTVRRGLFSPGATVERRPATVAEVRQALADAYADRVRREWFFGFCWMHDRDDVSKWLRERGRFKAKA